MASRIKDMTLNTFKLTPKPKPTVIISDRDMAIYNHVKLKLAYEKRAVEDIAVNIISAKHKRADRVLKLIGNSLVISIAIAVVGLVIKYIM